MNGKIFILFANFLYQFALDRHEHVSYVSAELVQQGSTPPASGKGICPSTGEPCDCGNQGKTILQPYFIWNPLEVFRAGSFLVWAEEKRIFHQ